MTVRLIVLITLFMLSSQSHAWIAFGFKSGMSRFDVNRYLAERESFVITEGAQHTFAGPADNRSQYNLVYCSTPQKLYLMKYSMVDSPEVFLQTAEKFEKRYGKLAGADYRTEYWKSGNWADLDISLIWDISESETILLTHRDNATSAEFQDVSVCG